MESSPFYTYMAHIAQALTFFPRDAVDIVSTLRNAKSKGYTVFTCGNGGSAATASHFSNDLAKAVSIKTICLNESIPQLMAWSNDVGYEVALTAQLALLAKPNDILFAISTSGESKNVLRAVSWAKKNKLTILSLTGASENPLLKLSDAVLQVNHQDIKIQEDVHSIYCHAIIHTILSSYSMQKNGANHR